MDILYLHGFGSRFDPESQKIIALQYIGDVHGFNINWTAPPQQTVAEIIEYVTTHDIELLAGTSMGGWGAAVAGSALGIPFVAINPAIEPQQSLLKYLGHGVDWYDTPYELTEDIVAQYNNLPKNGCGLILLDMGDKVIDAKQTLERYQEHYKVVTFKGGTHRFEHMEESLQHITAFINTALFVYGLDEN